MNHQPTRLFALALLLCLAGEARAQGDLDLLTTSVPPNVMLLFDSSGSMNAALWHEDFNPHVFHDTGIVTNTDPGCGSEIPNVPEISDSENICPGSGGINDTCPSSESFEYSGNKFKCRSVPGGCSAAPIGWDCQAKSGNEYEFTPPDLTLGSGKTRWSLNYLNWLFTQILNGTTPAIPDQDRLTAAREATKALIDDVNPDDGSGGYDENVRFGIATFDYDKGGFVRVRTGPGNKSSLMPSGWRCNNSS